MNIRTKIAALLLGATLAVGCTKSPDTIEPGSSELDWSQTSTITLDRVAMAPSAKATDALMKVGQTFRLYAIDPKTKNIIATRTYSIATTDGIPVIDATQNPIISLPFGMVDVYLVGPVKAMLSGTEYKIADSTKVNPMRGVDLVSSRTKVIVQAKETPITPTPLQHRMVKLELAVSMEKDGEPNPADLSSYKDAYMWGPKHWVSVDNVATTGTFAFDDGGSVAGTVIGTCLYTYKKDNTGEQNLKLTDVGIVGTERDTTGTAYSAYDYVFPTAATQPQLSVTYGYTSRDAGADRLVPAHEMSGKTAAKLSWAAGTYVKLHTKLTPSIVMVVRTNILPWDDGDTTSVAPPANNDLIFWYSGEDAPEMIDGKLCWRDRSGNGNHAVINGSMTYDEVNKCYYATTSADHFAVPALGKLAEYTLELTAQSVANAQNNAVDFSGATGLFTHLPYGNSTVFYTSTLHEYYYSGNDNYIYEQLNSYAFCRNQATAALVINGVEKKVEADASSWIAFNNNRLWGATTTGGVGKQKLYGAKMYKKYMNNTAGRNTLAANHAAKLSRLGVTASLSGTTFDYVKDGLLVDLRGETAISGRVWPDLSGRGNSPTLDAGVRRNTFSSGGLLFYEGTVDTDRIRFQKSLGTYKNLTIEIVTQSRVEQVTKPLIGFYTSVNMDPGRTAISWPYHWPYKLLSFDVLYDWTDRYRVMIPATEFPQATNSLVQLSCSRQGAKTYASFNGHIYSNYVVNNIPDKVSDLANGLIFPFNQCIFAVRIYNRALSDMERQHNYLVDKAKYNLLPPN